VLLARALVGQPDLLLLDEPTNHLDIEAIQWLESFLAEYDGAVMFVTHDRAFLQRLATRIIELDRGKLTSWPGNYATYLRRKEEALANEQVLADKFDKKLAEEEVWVRQGIKRGGPEMKAASGRWRRCGVERAARREQMGNVRLQVEQAEQSGKTGVRSQGRLEELRRRRSCGRPEAGDPKLLDARDPRRSDRPDRPEPAPARRRCCGCCSASSRRTKATSGSARTSRSRTTISSASSSIPNAPCSTR